MEKRKAPSLPEPQTMRAAFTVASLTETRGEDDGDDVLRLEGHASVFGVEYKVYGGPPYGWVERVETGAFDETLKEKPDVVFLRDHEGMALARTKSGTLTLEVDKRGLAIGTELDIANPEVVALRSGIERGDIDEMSFAFRVTEQMWAEHPDHEGDEMSLRKITAVNLNRGDVSAVTFGASPDTDIDIVRSLDRFSAEELAEARAAIDRRLKQGDPGGMPGEEDRGGMPPHLFELLRIPPNPILESYTP